MKCWINTKCKNKTKGVFRFRSSSFLSERRGERVGRLLAFLAGVPREETLAGRHERQLAGGVTEGKRRKGSFFVKFRPVEFEKDG